jgi:hypothetical protein
MRDDLNEMTSAALVELHDGLCPEGDRIGRQWKRAKSELVERVRPLLEHQELSDRSDHAAAMAASAAEPPSTVGRLVEALLVADEGSWSYGQIVEEVRRRFPEARTTARSVASVAADLRKRGVYVPSRRPSAKQ